MPVNVSEGSTLPFAVLKLVIFFFKRHILLRQVRDFGLFSGKIKLFGHGSNKSAGVAFLNFQDKFLTSKRDDCGYLIFFMLLNWSTLCSSQFKQMITILNF